jgi:peptidyl-prolyl cis-trans isomerase D
MILVEKLLDYLHLKPTKTNILAIASALYNSDKMSVKVLKRDEIKVSLDEDEVKAYWEKHKSEFLTPEKYKIAYVAIPLKANVSEEELREYYAQNTQEYKNDKGEILPFEKAKDKVKADVIAKKLKKEAIITYKKLKNNELNDYKLVNVEKINKIIPEEKMNDLIQNGYLKPFVYNNQYITAKLVEEIKPQPMPYTQARAKVMNILLQEKTTKELIKKAQNELKNFQGKDLGYVTKYDVNKIPELSPLYAEKFLFDVFTSQNPKGYVLIPQNNPKYAVLYNISAQKLLEKEQYEKNKQSVYMLSEAMLNSELLNDLIDSLKEKYKVVSYVK